MLSSDGETANNDTDGPGDLNKLVAKEVDRCLEQSVRRRPEE